MAVFWVDNHKNNQQFLIRVNVKIVSQHQCTFNCQSIPSIKMNLIIDCLYLLAWYIIDI